MKVFKKKCQSLPNMQWMYTGLLLANWPPCIVSDICVGVAYNGVLLNFLVRVWMSEYSVLGIEAQLFSAIFSTLLQASTVLPPNFVRFSRIENNILTLKMAGLHLVLLNTSFVLHNLHVQIHELVKFLIFSILLFSQTVSW